MTYFSSMHVAAVANVGNRATTVTRSLSNILELEA